MELLAPCRCVGTARFVHVECLRRWQVEVLSRPDGAERASICRVCQTPFSLPPPPAPELPGDRSMDSRTAAMHRAMLEPIFSNLSTNPYYDRSLSRRLPSSLRDSLLDAMRQGGLILRHPTSAPTLIRSEHWSQGVYLIGGGFPGCGHAGSDALVAVNLVGLPPTSTVLARRDLRALADRLGGVDQVRVRNGGPVQPRRVLVLVPYAGAVDETSLLRAQLVRVVPVEEAGGGPLQLPEEAAVRPDMLEGCSGALFGEPTYVLEALAAQPQLRALMALAFEGHALWSSEQLLCEIARGDWGLTPCRREDVAFASASYADRAVLWRHLWETRDPISYDSTGRMQRCMPGCVVS